MTETDGAIVVGEDTVKLKPVVLTSPPPDPVTTTLYVPAAVELLTFRVRTEEQLGPQLLDEKEAVIPDGNPETVNETAWVAPESKLALIGLVIEVPKVTD